MTNYFLLRWLQTSTPKRVLISIYETQGASQYTNRKKFLFAYCKLHCKCKMTMTLCHCSLEPVPFQLQAEMVLFDCQQGKTSGYSLPKKEEVSLAGSM